MFSASTLQPRKVTSPLIFDPMAASYASRAEGRYQLHTSPFRVLVPSEMVSSSAGLDGNRCGKVAWTPQFTKTYYEDHEA